MTAINCGKLLMKKGGSFQKKRFLFFFKSSMGGGVLTPKPLRAYATDARQPHAAVVMLKIFIRKELNDAF